MTSHTLHVVVQNTPPNWPTYIGLAISLGSVLAFVWLVSRQTKLLAQQTKLLQDQANITKDQTKKVTYALRR